MRRYDGAKYQKANLRTANGRIILADDYSDADGVSVLTFAQAQKLAPNAEDVAVALAEVRRRQGDADGAIDALQPFVKQNPEAKVATLALVAALREGGVAGQHMVGGAAEPCATCGAMIGHSSGQRSAIWNAAG